MISGGVTGQAMRGIMTTKLVVPGTVETTVETDVILVLLEGNKGNPANAPLTVNTAMFQHIPVNINNIYIYLFTYFNMTNRFTLFNYVKYENLCTPR